MDVADRIGRCPVTEKLFRVEGECQPFELPCCGQPISARGLKVLVRNLQLNQAIVCTNFITVSFGRRPTSIDHTEITLRDPIINLVCLRLPITISKVSCAHKFQGIDLVRVKRSQGFFMDAVSGTARLH